MRGVKRERDREMRGEVSLMEIPLNDLLLSLRIEDSDGLGQVAVDGWIRQINFVRFIIFT
jgi:hypothetical protein